MPEKSTPTDGEQSLEGPQKTAQQLSSGMPDTTPLDVDEIAATPNYQHAYNQLDNITETQRRRIATKMGRVVDLAAESESEQDGIVPENQQSELSEKCIKRIGRYFSYSYAAEKTEDAVWAEAIEYAIAVGDMQEMQPYESRGTALVMAKLSGVKLTDKQMVKCLEGSRMYTGIAAWNGETGQYEPVSIDEAEFARSLIDEDKTRFLADNLYDFRSLPADLAYELIEKYPDQVAGNLSSFENVDYNLLAHNIIDSGDTALLFDNLKEFKHLGNDIIDTCLAKDDLTDVLAVAGNLSSFENPDYQKIANKLIEGNNREHIGYLASYVNKFKNLNSETAQALLAYYPGDVITNRGVFKDLTIEQIADVIVERETRVIFNFIDHFTTEERGYLAERIMHAGTAYAALLLPQLEHFKNTNLDEDALTGMFMNNDTELLLDNLEHLTNQDTKAIVDSLIKQDRIITVVRHLSKLSDLSPDVAQAMVDLDSAFVYVDIAQHADAFQDPIRTLGLIPEYVWAGADFADAIVENIAKYNLPPDTLNDFLTKCAQNYSTAQKIKQLDLIGMGLDQEAVDVLLGHIATLKPEATGVAKENPFEAESGSMDIVTLSKPGTELHALGSKVSKQLREARDDAEHPLSHQAHLVDAYYKILVRRAQEKPEYGDVLGEETGSSTNSMYATYRRLAADFIAMEFVTNKDLERTVSDASKTDWEALDTKLSHALDEANQKFLDVLRTDVPYYDKLFTEWDAKRLGQKDFQEVFLGRDGVYAYIGRRAQIQARKRFLGLEGEEHDTTMPTYLVYPRDFRDNLTTETKDVYLRQNIPNPQAAHYYDTGFTGTVPQDIMKVLGLSEADWDERIRLLSGTKRDRTVLGLEGSENERHQIVNTIEYNVKNERTAAGLYSDENDELQPYAEPTSPKDRLQFAFVQQALHRHYYVKEMEALQGAETRVAMTATSLQSGELRLSTKLDDTQKQQLTEFFDHDNIGQRLLSGAKQIKISDPSDPYPDEAVFEIPLAGTDGVIVKSVVTDKQQGPLDEFEALLLLQKVGVDSPTPLGRIFTDGQHGFVIMEKLPGISGRAIQQYFDDNNISEEDQQGILAYTKDKMQEIAETIRRDTGLDKPWRLKDFMLVFETLPTTVDRMLPIDFERANVFDPQNPQSIEI